MGNAAVRQASIDLNHAPEDFLSSDKASDANKQKSMRTRQCMLRPHALWNRHRHMPSVAAVEHDTLMVYGAYLEPREIRRWDRLKFSNHNNNDHSHKNNTITRVTLLNCCRSVDSTEVAVVQQLIRLLHSHAPHLQWLLMTGPLLLHTSEQASFLLRSIHTQELERLCLGLGHAATAELGETLAQLFAKCRHLKHVNLNCISWRNKSALYALAQGIPISSSLSHLDLTSCRIDDQGFHLFVQALLKNERCTSPENDTNNNISSALSHGNEKVSHLALETLILRRNHLTSASLKDLAALLTSPSITLAHLNLNCMRSLFESVEQDREGFQAFIQAIQENVTLQVLDLAVCGLTLPCLRSLLQAVSSSSSQLQVFNVNNNLLESQEDQLELLVEFLPKLGHLSTLQICLNKEPPNEQAATDSSDLAGSSSVVQRNLFLRALSENWSLTQLNLDYNDALDAAFTLNHAATTQNQGCVSLQHGVEAVTQRNWLAQRLDHSAKQTKEPLLAALPHVLTKTICSNKSLLGEHAQHQPPPPSLIYQVLERHLVDIAAAATKNNSKTRKVNIA
ncbi:hypothetical protein ACA910_005142 [Epithemia clementina (nom. ined.)]